MRRPPRGSNTRTRLARQVSWRLLKYARQNQKTGVSRTFVAVALSDIPENKRKRLPKYPVPVAHLGRLAVDVKTQGQRLGEFLLIDALRRIQTAADSIGIHAVEVVALDDVARGFYSKYGFIDLLDDPHHLYLSMKTVRRLGLV